MIHADKKAAGFVLANDVPHENDPIVSKCSTHGVFGHVWALDKTQPMFTPLFKQNWSARSVAYDSACPAAGGAEWQKMTFVCLILTHVLRESTKYPHHETAK